MNIHIGQTNQGTELNKLKKSSKFNGYIDALAVDLIDIFHIWDTQIN